MIHDVHAALTSGGYEVFLLFGANEEWEFDPPDFDYTWLKQADLQYIQAASVLGMKAFVINRLLSPSFDKYPHIHYMWFARASQGLVSHFEVCVSVGAISLVSLPLAIAGKSHISWIATLYRDELQGKTLSDQGDRAANELLNNSCWKNIERLERYAYEKTSLIFPLSEYTAQRIHNVHSIDSRRIGDVLYPPIDTAMFNSSNRSLIGSPHETQIEILCAARINDPRKNIRMLMQAMLYLRPEFSVKLLLVGEEPNSSLRELCKQLQLTDIVNFLGEWPREQLVQLYKKAHVFVLPSIQEGLGIVVLEAMSCGLPVVTTTSGGPEHIVKVSEAGIVCPISDEALATSLRSLIQNQALWLELSRNGRTFVEHNLRWSGFSERILTTIDRTSRAGTE